MTGENQEVAQTEEQELTEVMAGYNGTARAEEAPAEEVDADPSNDQKPAEEPPSTPSIEDELKALKEKVHGMAESSDPNVVRKMYGEIGNINRTLQQLQSAPKAEAAPAEKAAALVLKRLSTEYPELAQPLAEDISEAIQTAIAHVRPTDDVDAKISAKVTEIRQRDAIEALAEEHPDFETVRETPAYRAWLATKTPEYQERFTTTWNPAVVSKGLTEFKTYQATQDNTRERKQNRLAAAVTPQGTNQQAKPSTLPDEEGFNVGYYGKSKRR